MENQSGGNKRKIGENIHLEEDHQDFLSTPIDQLFLETFPSKRTRNLTDENDEDPHSIKSVMNQIAHGRSSLAVKALSIVLQHWIIPDLGCSFDPLKERLPIVKAEACNDLMQNEDGKYDKINIDFRLNYWVGKDDKFCSIHKDIAKRALINLPVETLLPLPLSGNSIPPFLRSEDNLAQLYYKREDLLNIAKKMYSDYWFPLSKIYEVDIINGILVLKRTYDEFASSMSIYFQKQQEQFAVARGDSSESPSMLIVYQLFTFQRFRENLLIRLEKLLVFITTLPPLIEVDRVNSSLFDMEFTNSYYSGTDFISALQDIKSKIVRLVLDDRVEYMHNFAYSFVERLRFAMCSMQCSFQYSADPIKYMETERQTLQQHQTLKNQLLQELAESANAQGEHDKALKILASRNNSPIEVSPPSRFTFQDILHDLDVAYNVLSENFPLILKWSGHKYSLNDQDQDNEIRLSADRRVYYTIRDVRLDYYIFSNLKIVTDIHDKQRLSYYAQTYDKIASSLSCKYSLLSKLHCREETVSASSHTANDQVVEEGDNQLPLIPTTPLTSTEQIQINENLNLIEQCLFHCYQSLAIRRQMIENPYGGYTYHYQTYGALTRREISFVGDNIAQCAMHYFQECEQRAKFDTAYRQLLTPKYDENDNEIPPDENHVKKMKTGYSQCRRICDHLLYAATVGLPKAYALKQDILNYALDKCSPSEVMYVRPLLNLYMNEVNDDQHTAVVGKKLIKLQDGLATLLEDHADNIRFCCQESYDQRPTASMLFCCDMFQKACESLQKAIDLIVAVQIVDAHNELLVLHEIVAEVYDALAREAARDRFSSKAPKRLEKLEKISSEVDHLYNTAQYLSTIIDLAQQAEGKTTFLLLHKWKFRAIHMRLSAILLVIEFDINDPNNIAVFVDDWEAEEPERPPIYSEDGDLLKQLPSRELFVIQQAYILTDALFGVFEALFPLLHSPSGLSQLTSLMSSDVDGSGTYWQFLTAIFFWLEKALEGIVMCRFEMDQIPGSRCGVYDRSKPWLGQTIRQHLNFILGKACKYSDNSRSWEIKSFVPKKAPDAARLVRYLGETLDYVTSHERSMNHADSPEDVIAIDVMKRREEDKDEDDLAEEELEKDLAKGRIAVLRSFAADRDAIIQSLHDIATHWNKEVESSIMQYCENDKEKRFKANHRKTIFTRNQTK